MAHRTGTSGGSSVLVWTPLNSHPCHLQAVGLHSRGQRITVARRKLGEENVTNTVRRLTAGALARGAVQPEYLPLHKYLATRYADVVVLTFAQMEDLLGYALPDSARFQPEWWADDDTVRPRSAQARAWTLADRTATPNLVARTVMFERTRE